MKTSFYAYLSIISILITCCMRKGSGSAQMTTSQDTIMHVDSSCTKKITKDFNIASVFLDYNLAEDVTVFDSIGQVIKTIRNDIENENFIMFQLLEKNDSMFHVIAYWSLEQEFIVDGWICNKTRLWIFSSLYTQGLTLYKAPYNREDVVVKEKEYNPEMYKVIDFESNWLKIETKVGNRVYQGWMRPENQCSNVYSTCN